MSGTDDRTMRLRNSPDGRLSERAKLVLFWVCIALVSAGFGAIVVEVSLS